MDSIKVFAPATVANVTCGFDILGFAVENPGDEIILKTCKKPGVVIREIKGDEGRLSHAVEENTATISILNYLTHVERDIGLEVYLHKKMPFGSGLGSSAASSVAGVFAINQLMGQLLTTEELLKFALEGERVASGTGHADNVAPSLMGGFVLIRSYDPLDVIKINTPENLHAVIIHPNIEVNTKDARNILKKNVPIKSAIRQWGNVGGLIAGLTMNDFGLISRSMEDAIFEPVRSMLIPGFDQVKASALEAGALGCGISGSGPSIFALSTADGTARKIGTVMKDQFAQIGIESEIFVSKINQKGPVILD
ncbi:homoserine kinase [Fulvivirgaceae bacterium BMA12]|uniref:Homoserine kinase n=1 Tax=Agaribacillus aureus TaxID=3051825 RepID=A0ABT8LAV6_9BACT|nr:homoserine kinase [Fulvivirgaceae bacterium BMA12]